MNAQKPIVFDGMKIFPLTYATVGSVSFIFDIMHDYSRAKISLMNIFFIFFLRLFVQLCHILCF